MCVRRGHDVDAPAEVIGAERCRAHPQVQRRDVAELAAQSAQAVVQQRGACRAVVLEARARHARGEHELEGQLRAVGGHQHRLVVDGDDPRRAA